ncbi:MAG TPA: energy transducer TonB [Candidatus Kapabacteria bacterium]|nr:energy transducer TonB [Candidatus Kapabacteria bacterium]
MIPNRYRWSAAVGLLLAVTSTLTLQARQLPSAAQTSAPSTTHGPAIDLPAMAARIDARLRGAKQTLPDGLDILVSVDSTGRPVGVSDYRGFSLRTPIARAILGMKFGPAVHAGRPVSAVQWIHLQHTPVVAAGARGGGTIALAMLYDETSDGSGNAPQLPLAVGADTPDRNPAYDSVELQRRIIYPATARARGIEGTVLVRALVSSGGVVRELHIDGSDGSELEEAAVHAVAGTRFSPARAHGKPAAAWIQIPIAFRLR